MNGKEPDKTSSLKLWGGQERWYIGGLPGFLGITLIVVARFMGVFQTLELDTLDAGLRWRPPEPMDEHIVIVGIDEADIQAIGTYPIPDGIIAQLLRQLQTYQPRVIGLDIVKDLPVEPGHQELVTTLTAMPNVIGVESVVPDLTGAVILPPPSLPPERIGFIDLMLDNDGHYRRGLLGSPATDGSYRLSLAIKLAAAYLQPYGIELGNGIRDPNAMRFADQEFPLVYPNSGGYINTDADGNQTLIHFRSGSTPFQFVSLTEILEQEVEPEWFRDRIVLIGITAKSVKDYTQVAAIKSSNPGLVFGVELHAHIISQMVSAVLDQRPLLRAWPDGWEYAWIVLWGMVGMVIGQLDQRPDRHILLVGSIIVGLVAISYGSLLMGWWLPLVPTLAVVILNGLILHTVSLYNHALQSRIRDRQLVIEQTFTAIHNGPLQTLAKILRELDTSDAPAIDLKGELTQLNRELREIYNAIQANATQENRLHLQGQVAFDLTQPLHELLYSVYSDTLQRDFPHFSTIKAKIVKFEAFDEAGLTTEHKRSLCRFLEEALCNVGKHATNARRLCIDCRYDGQQNIIRVIDNGSPNQGANQILNGELVDSTVVDSTVVDSTLVASKQALDGRGTQQAQQLAQRLGGQFTRRPNAASKGVSPHHSQGTCCEIIWQPRLPLLVRIRKQIMAVFSK